MAQQALFDQIKQRMSEEVNEEFIKSTKTEKGNTQVSERVVIEKIRQVLTSLSLTFEEAGSQQSKDFRNVGGIGLSIEVKKTDNPTIYFNDTCPSKDIYYIIFFTGKEYKRTPEKNVLPCLLYINGEEFIKDSPWIVDYIAELTALKDKYARGENKKRLAGIMEVYPRPTFKANISRFLGIKVLVDDEQPSESQLDVEPPTESKTEDIELELSIDSLTENMKSQLSIDSQNEDVKPQTNISNNTKNTNEIDMIDVTDTADTDDVAAAEALLLLSKSKATDLDDDTREEEYVGF